MSDSQYSLHVISAFFGTVDVSAKVRVDYTLYADKNRSSNVYVITPSNTFFGLSSKDTSPKSLVIVWRTILGGELADNEVFSAPQLFTCDAGKQGSLNYDGSNLDPFVEPTDPANGIYLMKAVWYNLDVTSYVQDIIQNSSSTSVPILAANSTFGNQDPYQNLQKPLIVQYALATSDGSYTYNTIWTMEGTTLTIHGGKAAPRLVIQWADFGGKDFTDQVQALTTFDQKLTYDSANWKQYGWQDPWPKTTKVLSVLYQWEGRGLEMIVAIEGSGSYVLDPTVAPDPARSSKYFNSLPRNAGELNVIAMVWGTNNVSQDLFNSVEEFGYFIPNNSFMGSNIPPSSTKTAQVFFQYGVTGQIQCTSAHEDPKGASVFLNPRSVQMFDPLPSEGLLATDPDVQKGLRFKAPGGNYLTANTLSNILEASTVNPNAAAIFNIVNNNNGLPVLNVDSGDGVDRYLIAYTPSADPTANAIWLTRDIKQATEFHYEIPGFSGSVSLALSFPIVPNPSHSTNASNDPWVFVMLPGTGFVSMASIYDSMNGALVPFSQCLFQFEWVDADEKALYISNDEAKTTLEGVSALPCIIANLKLLKDFLWDLPLLITGATPGWANGIIKGLQKWWNKLSSVVQANLILVVNKIKDALNVGGGGGSTFTQIWEEFQFILKEAYKTKALWSFYSYAGKALSWLDCLLIVANIIKMILADMSAVVFPAAPAIMYAADAAIWAGNTTKDLVSFVRGCIPASLSSMSGKGMAALLSSVQRTLSTSKAVAQLTTFQRGEVYRALLTPHWHRIYAGGSIKPPAEHRHKALKRRMHEPGVPDDELIVMAMHHEISLNNEVREIVDELRPQVEDDMMNFDPDSAYTPVDGVVNGDAKVPVDSVNGSVAAHS